MSHENAAASRSKSGASRGCRSIGGFRLGHRRSAIRASPSLAQVVSSGYAVQSRRRVHAQVPAHGRQIQIVLPVYTVEYVLAVQPDFPAAALALIGEPRISDDIGG